MYGHNYEYVHYGYNNTMMNNNVEHHDHLEFSNIAIPTIPSPMDIPYQNNVINYDHDSISALKSEMCYSSTSGCSSYGSPTSHNNNALLLQRSISTLSLQKNNVEGFSHHHPLLAADQSSETTSVRKAFSAGDLHEMNMVQRNYHRSESPLSIEKSIIESMSKACRYSPEEKKERIERYRSKRNLRNFNKKIKYECRKTLADSRPRIRGRFARNDEIEKSDPQNEWSQANLEEDDEDIENWLNFLDAYSANLIQ